MEPPTLFKLSWRITLQNAREGRVDLNSQNFPKDFGEKVINQSELTLFTDAFHPKTIRWFSENVFPRPQVMSVEIGRRVGIIRNKHFCNIRLTRPEDEGSPWFKWDLILSNDYENTEMIQFGSKTLPTKFDEKKDLPPLTNKFLPDDNDQDVLIESYVSDLKQTQEMIEWICLAFRCDISCLYIETLPLEDAFEDAFNEWPRFRDAKLLAFESFEDLEVVLPAIKERQRKNLRTKLYYAELTKPFPASLLSFELVDVRWSKFNLSEFTFDEFMNFMRQVGNQGFFRIELLAVPRMSAEQFEIFKTEFNLFERQRKRFPRERRSNYISNKKLLFRFRENRRCVAKFELFHDKEGVCQAMKIFQRRGARKP